jgi:hypothetical protein
VVHPMHVFHQEALQQAVLERVVIVSTLRHKPPHNSEEVFLFNSLLTKI